MKTRAIKEYMDSSISRWPADFFEAAIVERMGRAIGSRSSSGKKVLGFFFSSDFSELNLFNEVAVLSV